MGLGIWVAVWPRPYGVVIGLVMILPLIALAIAGWSRGLVALVFSKTDPRPNLGAPLFLGVVLLIRAMDASLLDWRPTLVALGAALTVIAVATDPKLWAIKSNLFSAGLMLTLYAGSSVVLIDRLADNTHPKVFATQVLDMWVRHGKSTSYNLKLAPWGPVATVDSISVSASTYQQTSVGQTVCVGLHPGAFALRWFVLQACEGLVTTESDRSPRPGLAQLPNADAMAALYPDAAARANVTGRAQFRCTVTSDGGLTDCVIVSESPPAYGFGDATLKLAKLLRMEPVGPDGASTAGQSLVETVVWRLPGAAASAPTSATATPAPPPNPG